jgi:ferrous iron transport protein B
MAERGWAFLARAGTVIFAVTIVVWALAYYPRAEGQVAAEIAAQRAQLQDDPTALAEFNKPQNLERLSASLHERYSFLGRAGHWIEPAVRPLGWDWRIGCAAIASFPAREVVMGVLGVIYQLGRDVDVGAEGTQHDLQAQLQAARWDDTGEAVYNLPVALSIMVFFALCAQCAATLAVIRRETNSWRWPAFTFAYMTTLAYVGAFITYQISIRIFT